MNKKILFFAFAGIFASAQALFAQEFQGVRANPDPLEERIRLNPEYIPNYRELMRNIVETLKDYVRETKPDFLIIADGATELLTRGEWENALDELHRAEAAGAKTEDERYLLKLFSPEDLIPEGTPDRRYIQSLNAVLVTNAVCGKNALPDKTKKLLNEFGVSLLGAEHCKTEKEKNNALLSLAKQGIPAHTDTDIYGKNITGKALCLPVTIGSTTGGLVIQTVCSMKINPACFLFSKHIDSLAASGIILAKVWEGSPVIAVDMLGDEFLETVKTGDKLRVDEDGTVTIL